MVVGKEERDGWAYNDSGFILKIIIISEFSKFTFFFPSLFQNSQYDSIFSMIGSRQKSKQAYFH